MPRKIRKGPSKPAAAAQRRSYDSPLRRQQAAETRERIVAAGAGIAHELASWDLTDMTFGAVGERAGVSERTVHRYFASERQLREAVVQRLLQESGLRFDGLELRDFAGAVRRTFSYLSSFSSVAQSTSSDPTLAAIDQERRNMLLRAVAKASPGWSEREQSMAAAMLDILWNPFLYERLTSAWGLDAARSVGAIAWVIGLVEKAIHEGRPPRP